MEDKLMNQNSVSDLPSNGSEMLPWVSPLESIKKFSIAELTQTDSSPGDDGNGVFTHS